MSRPEDKIVRGLRWATAFTTLWIHFLGWGLLTYGKAPAWYKILFSVSVAISCGLAGGMLVRLRKERLLRDLD